jgi:hypothetical protein
LKNFEFHLGIDWRLYPEIEKVSIASELMTSTVYVFDGLKQALLMLKLQTIIEEILGDLNDPDSNT